VVAQALHHSNRLDKLLDWLRREAAAMTPAADPLPALRPALAWLCRQWRREGDTTLVEELENWAERDL